MEDKIIKALEELGYDEEYIRNLLDGFYNLYSGFTDEELGRNVWTIDVEDNADYDLQEDLAYAKNFIDFDAMGKDIKKYLVKIDEGLYIALP